MDQQETISLDRERVLLPRRGRDDLFELVWGCVIARFLPYES